MKNWTHQIIEELRDKYSETTTELNAFVIKKFGIKKDDLIKSKKIKENLKIIIKKGFWFGKRVKKSRTKKVIL